MKIASGSRADRFRRGYEILDSVQFWLTLEPKEDLGIIE